MRQTRSWPLVVFASLMLNAASASAQTVGTFSWQLQPYCNRLVLTATQHDGVIALAGYDDSCGAGPRGAVTGVAFPNPDGTIGLGLSGVATPRTTVFSYFRAVPDIYATINLATLSGTWQDTVTQQGTFAFAAMTGGPRRLQLPFNAQLVDFNDAPSFLAYSASGTSEAPAAIPGSRALAGFWGGGYDGTSLAVSAGMQMYSVEAWTPTAHGTELRLLTTAPGSTQSMARLRIAADGRVAIGNHAPQDVLDVDGDIRVGTSGTNGCLKNNGGAGITGVCSSDRRFKRDITPFAPALDAVARLRPVHYFWRAAQFPAKGFGEKQSYGLVAQEVATVLPELVTTDAEGYQAIDYAKLPLLAIQAIAELKAENQSLRQQLDAQRADLERRLAAIEAKFEP